MKNRKSRNITVKDDIQIGYPRNEKVCFMCHNKINKIGIKFKTVSANPWSVIRTYWAHMHCVYNVSSENADNLCCDRLITTGSFGCTYCKQIDPNKEMYRFYALYLHPVCMDRLRRKFQKVFDEHELELSVKMI